MGMPRRDVEYFEPAYRPWTLIALFGAVLVLAALASLVIQLLVSIRNRADNLVPVGDPWNGRTLEWSMSAPPPEYNFATIPFVEDIDGFNKQKDENRAYQRPARYEPIEMPANSAVAPVIGAALAACGFALTWHIWWLATLGLLVTVTTVIARSFVRETHRTIGIAEIRAHEEPWLEAASATVPVNRDRENETANKGRAMVGVA